MRARQNHERDIRSLDEIESELMNREPNVREIRQAMAQARPNPMGNAEMTRVRQQAE